MIPLMKNTFLNEYETKKALTEFIMIAPRLSMDTKCFEFEQEFSKFQQCRESILFNSGGSANLALLQALKNLNLLKLKDKIGFSALTWSTNVMPIIQLGMYPVPIDIEPTTLNSMSYNLEHSLKENDIDAFFITNALGFSGDLAKIKKICHDNDIILIEDNCEALGTELPEGKTGNFGIASTFSFFVAHHMSTIEGGMVCTNDKKIAEMLRIVRANGWDRNLICDQKKKWREKYHIINEFDAKYTFFDLGFNLRPTEITGFLGLFQLQFLKENIDKREHNYLELENIAIQNSEFCQLNHSHISRLSSFAYPIVCKNSKIREKYFYQFSGAGIEIRPMIAGNIQNQPFYSKYQLKKDKLLGTDFINNCSFYCGNYPELSYSDLQTISGCLFEVKN